MCGISGSVGIVHDLSLKILNHQRKRGPDNTGWKLIDGVFLGHNRLSILDLSEKGNQPMTSPSGRYSITYNGEIYNFQDFDLYETNDARALLYYIDKNGLEYALQNANGMYAYCCFDAVLKQIHLITDRFGQKPLYYCHSGASFVFASSVGALLQIQDKWELNRDALQSYWLLGAPMGDETLFKGIKKLTGSHHLTYDIRENKVSIERYWTPKFQENTSGIEDLVLDAINKVKVSDVPVYVFLSGGIDSTLVASQCTGMHAVHLNSPEYAYAARAAERFGMKLIQVNPESIDVEESLQGYAFQGLRLPSWSAFNGITYPIHHSKRSKQVRKGCDQRERRG
jgi:asparagine synthase (glutamine-hydrolysing)